MSTYATIQANYKYKDKDAFNAALKLLKDGGWIDDKNQFLDEAGEPIEVLNVRIDEDVLTIEIPYNNYRNLVRYIGPSLEGSHHLFEGATGLAVWTSTDGMFSGGVIADGVETGYDLGKWAKENDDGEEIPDFETDPDSWADWSIQVENDFMEQMYR